MPQSAPTGDPGSWTTLADQVEARVVARLDGWLAAELDEHVLRLIDDRLQEETERRGWRQYGGVF